MHGQQNIKFEQNLICDLWWEWEQIDSEKC